MVIGLGRAAQLAARTARRGRAARRRRRARPGRRRVPVLRLHAVEADDPRRAHVAEAARRRWPASAGRRHDVPPRSLAAPVGRADPRGHRRLARRRAGRGPRRRPGSGSCAGTAGSPAPAGAGRDRRRARGPYGPPAASSWAPAPSRRRCPSTGWRRRRTGPTARRCTPPRPRPGWSSSAAARSASSWRRPSRASAAGSRCWRSPTGCSAARSPRRRGACTTRSRAEGARRAHRRRPSTGSSTTARFRVVVDGEDARGRAAPGGGRAPDRTCTDLGLETVGLDPDADTVEVDERLRAGERLWAVGDITGKGAYTHVAKYQAVGVVRDVLGQDGPPADYRAVSPGHLHRPRGGRGGTHRGAGPRGRGSPC